MSNTHFSKRVSLFLTLLKEHIRLGHAGIVDHLVQFTDTALKKNIKRNGQNNKFKRYSKSQWNILAGEELTEEYNPQNKLFNATVMVK